MPDMELVIAKLAEALKGPAPFDELLAYAQLMPEPWRDWPPERWFEGVRMVLQTTQDQIALKSGLTQSQVSRLEGGEDTRLSTWKRAYAAMGFDVAVVPIARFDEAELRRMSEEGRMTDRWWRQHARPRRRRMRERAAERAAARARAGAAPDADEGAAPDAGRSPTAPSGTPPGPSSPPR